MYWPGCGEERLKLNFFELGKTRFRSPVQSAKGYKFSPLMKAPDRTFEALVGSMNCDISVMFIKSLNQSSIIWKTILPNLRALLI